MMPLQLRYYCLSVNNSRSFWALPVKLRLKQHNTKDRRVWKKRYEEQEILRPVAYRQTNCYLDFRTQGASAAHVWREIACTTWHSKQWNSSYWRSEGSAVLACIHPHSGNTNSSNTATYNATRGRTQSLKKMYKQHTGGGVARFFFWRPGQVITMAAPKQKLQTLKKKKCTHLLATRYSLDGTGID